MLSEADPMAAEVRRTLTTVRSRSVTFEQAVYGSFPFWDRGYDVLAQSPGCRAEWLADFRAACQSFGERPPGVAPAPAPVRAAAAERPLGGRRGRARRGSTTGAAPAPWPSTPCSSRPRDYRKAGSDPFAFAGALRRDWSAGTTLDALVLDGRAPPEADPADRPADPPGRSRPWREAGGSRSRRPGRSTASPARSGRRCPVDPVGGPRWRPGRSATATGSTWSPSPGWRASRSTDVRRPGLDRGSARAGPALRRLPVVGMVAPALAVGLGGRRWRGGRWPSAPAPRHGPRPPRPRPSRRRPPPPIDARGAAPGSSAGLVDLADRFEAFEVGGRTTPAT